MANIFVSAQPSISSINKSGMRRLCLILIFVCAITFTINAQQNTTVAKSIKISVAGNIGVTLGDYSAFSVLTYGGDVQGEYTVSPKFAITLSGGFVALSRRFSEVLLPSFLPVLAGGRYYFFHNIYASLQAGTSFIIQPRNTTYALSTGQGNEFTFAPGIGYRFSKNIDMLFKYQSSNKNDINFSFSGLRIAYVF
jgi:hypothetical protein